MSRRNARSAEPEVTELLEVKDVTLQVRVSSSAAWTLRSLAAAKGVRPATLHRIALYQYLKTHGRKGR